MLSFHKTVEADFLSVNEQIIEQLHSNVGLIENIGHYIVDAGGKRLRPLVVLLVAKCLGYEGRNHISMAAIIEFIHTATLLHDDVVDVSTLRRGRPTANAQWGNASSILVGDFLYSRAFQMMVALENHEIMAIISDTTNMISEGEVQQLVNAKDPSLSEADYIDVIRKKTGVLFEAACETAAILAMANGETRRAINRYGYHLGIAFQLVDDALDYEGSTEELGKNLGDDLAEGKPTLPLIHAMQHAPPAESQIIADALRQGDGARLQDIVSIVRASDSLQYTYQLAKQHGRNAIETIDALPDNHYRSALINLAEFATERSF